MIIATPRLTEKRWQGQVVTYARIMGWRVYHTYDARKSAPGFPDLVMTRRPRVVFAELKAERGRLTDDQRAWLEDLRSCGQEAYVFKPSQWSAVEKILR